MNYWLDLEKRSDDKLDALLKRSEENVINTKDPVVVAAWVQRAAAIWARVDEMVSSSMPMSDIEPMSLRDATEKVLSVLKEKGMSFEYEILPSEDDDKVTVQLVVEKHSVISRQYFDVKRDTSWLTGKT